jgi:hypothetical protein
MTGVTISSGAWTGPSSPGRPVGEVEEARVQPDGMVSAALSAA